MEKKYLKNRPGVLNYPFRLERAGSGFHVWIMNPDKPDDVQYRSFITFSEGRKLYKWIESELCVLGMLE